MAFTIRKPADKRFVKALVFAPAGAGKTVLAGTAQLDERTSPALLLDFEGGSESLAGLDIDIGEIKTWEDYNEAFELLVSGDHGYKSVILDSISETHKWALLQVLAKNAPKRDNPDHLEQGDYGTATIQMRKLLREFRDLPMHVFYTAHAKEVEIPREGRVRLPDMAGQMAEEVSGIVSVQGYLAQFEEDGEIHRTLLLHSFPKFRIKARTPWEVSVPEELIDPTVTHLLDALGYGEGNGYVETRSSRGHDLDNQTDEPEEEGKEEGEDGKKENEETEASSEASGPEASEDELPQYLAGLEKLSLPELKKEAEKQEVPLDGARTRTQIIVKIKEAFTQGDEE